LLALGPLASGLSRPSDFSTFFANTRLLLGLAPYTDARGSGFVLEIHESSASNSTWRGDTASSKTKRNAMMKNRRGGGEEEAGRSGGTTHTGANQRWRSAHLLLLRARALATVVRVRAEFPVEP